VNKPIWAAFALTFALMCSTAVAQTPTNAVIEHFRAYRAAMAQNDLAAADVAAAAALAASEAQDGDGGRTGVLALNLAILRLDRNDAAGALPPARRAYALAQQGAVGVDLNHARLTAARARLATEGEAALSEVVASIEAANAAGVAGDVIQPAAMDLAVWTFAHERYEASQAAWSMVGASVAGDSQQAAYLRGRAKLGEGAAVFMQLLERRSGRREFALEANALMLESRQMLSPLAEQESPNGGMTLAQLSYAEALAWRGALSAVASTSQFDLPQEVEPEGDADGFVEMSSAGGSAPRCALDYRLNQDAINFPQREMIDEQVGAVVTRFNLNDAGEITERGVVARVGSPAFARAVEAQLGTWEISRDDEESEAGCRMAMTVFRTVVFRFAN
jgi:hypothetical protein